jgi:myo-inositol-1(or 4)-monophosphatase
MNISKKDTRELITCASDIALGAGEILRKGFKRRHNITYKGRIDPVTEYDLKSEKYIISRIRKKFPDHAILSEEGHGRKSDNSFRWIIDPLDGTVNYAHGFPVYCVSIAIEYENDMLVGVVYDPERDELFTAGKSLGAYMNRQKIHVSTEKNLERALLATGFGYNVKTARKNNLGLFARMVKTAQAVRRPGSAAIDLCWLAAGRLDGFWEFYLHPWDTAAGILIVEEAGGRVTRIDGRPYSIFHIDILASNGFLHKKMQNTLTSKSNS